MSADPERSEAGALSGFPAGGAGTEMLAHALAWNGPQVHWDLVYWLLS